MPSRIATVHLLLDSISKQCIFWDLHFVQERPFEDIQNRTNRRQENDWKFLQPECLEHMCIAEDNLPMH